MVSITDAENATTPYRYDGNGNQIAVVDALLQTSQSRYDEKGQQIEAILPDRTPNDDMDNPRLNTLYDRGGRRRAMPEGERSNSTYNAVGNLETHTDFNGKTTTYRYDAQNRLKDKDFEDDPSFHYTYTATGQIETIIDGRGVTHFKYDEWERLIGRTDPDGPYLPSGFTLEYAYDRAGNRTAVHTPNGSTTYTYDERNRLKTVTAPDDAVTTYFYNDVNNLVRTELPNHTVETRRYDDLNRLGDDNTL